MLVTRSIDSRDAWPRAATRVRRAGSLLAGVVLACLVSAGPLAGQTTPDPFDTARHRSGALAMNPELALVDLGVDTNVFYEVDAPRRDFTMTFRPAADIWLRAGHLRAAAHTQVALNYFQQFSSERSANTDNRLRLELRGPRLTPFGSVSFLSSRDRTPEIDARVRRQERSGGAGVDVVVGPRLTARVETNRFVTRYADSSVARGYAIALDRSEQLYRGALRYRATPLTTFVLQADRQANAFTFANERDATTVSVVPGIEFDRAALISGRGFVGYRRFDFTDARLRDFRGLVASVDLGYTLRGQTRFGVTADRNVEYSFEIQQPYYVTSGAGVNLSQQFTERWSAQTQIQQRRLDYRRALLTVAVPPRTDHVTYVSAGLGFRPGLHSRFDLTVSYQRRSSERLDREYDGLRAGGGFLYEF
ncbi:MAG: outer membrane beta-barrel protein [Vicinamibacterales bacterium]